MKKKSLLIILFTCVIALSTGAAVLSNKDAAALEATPTQSVSIVDKYLKGDTLTVPEVTLDCDGDEIKATAVIVAPSGERTQKDSVTLNEPGKWRIEYRAVKEGKLYRYDKDFSVVSSAFEINDNLGSVSYGAHEYREDLEGLVVSLKPGGTLRVNQAIDIARLSKSDEVLRFFVAPETVGTPDVSCIKITFTDAHDSSNFITVKFKNVFTPSADWTKYWAYFAAGASSQPLVGIEKKQQDGKLHIVYNGATYILHSNNQYGTPVNFSYGASPIDKGVGDEKISMAWDLSEKKLFANGTMISDFDEPILYRSNLWEGFESGEVFIDITAENYNANSCNFVIESIYGVDLTKGEHADEGKPEINIETPQGEVYARVNKPFNIYKATARDAYDESVRIDTKVYYNYMANRNIVDIERGAFTPKESGLYTIVYTATDKSGNETVKTVEVTAVENEELLVSATGCEVKLAPVVTVPVPSISNISGKATVKVTAVKGEESFEIKDYKFSPLTVGDYLVTYEVSDFVSTVRVTATVKIKEGDAFAFENLPSVPDYFIAGKYYSLPSVTAYDYTGNAVKKAEVSVSVSEDGATYAPVTGRYTAGNADFARVRYSIEGSTVYYEKEVKIVAVKEGSALKMDRYFQSDNLLVTANDDNVSITANGEGVVDFINPLQAYNFTMTFKIPQYSAKSFDIYLRSGEDTVKISYAKKANGAELFINDEKSSIPILDVFNGTVNLSYDAKTKTLSPCSEVEIKIDKTLEGKDFNGFSNDTVNLSLGFTSVSGSTTLAVNNINGQPFSSLARDLIAPQVLGEVIRGDILPGTEVTVQPAIVADVLDPNLQITMSIVGPDGNPVTAVDGRLLDDCSVYETYTIRPTEYGNYMIKYSATDTSGRKSSPAYGFIVVDNIAPVIKLEGVSTSAKVGEFVALAKASATDAVDGTVKVFTTVKTPDSRVYTVEDGAIKVTDKGIYTVSYIAYDSSGNAGTVSYQIKVE